jgi:hypothetical protein
MPVFDELTASALVTFIQSTVTLKELHVAGIGDACDSSLFLHALQQNGSLINVVLLRGGHEGFSLFNEAQQLQVRAVSERNRNIPHLFAMQTDLLPLLPTMFLVAKQMLRVRHTMILMGLLVAMDYCHLHNKT